MIKLLHLSHKRNWLMPHKDQHYIIGLKQNDKAIIQRMKKEFYPQVERFVIKNSGSNSDVGDLFHDALLALWEKVQSQEVVLTVPFGGYFYGIYRNLWLKKLRKKGNILEISELPEFEDENMLIADNETLNEKKRAIFYDCLKQLDERCWKILDLSFCGIKAEQIATEMEMTDSNTVHQAMFKCRNKLKQIVEKHVDFKDLDKLIS